MIPQAARRWFTFAAMSSTFFVVSAGAFSSLGRVLVPMVNDQHWSWTQAGLGYTLLGVACGIASFIPAVLIRRIGVRGNMLVGALTMVAGFAAMALTHSVLVYLLATVLIGIAFALVSTVPGTHVLTDLFKNRSTVIGSYFFIGALGGVAGPLIFEATQHVSTGWRPYWWVFVGMAIVSGLFAVLTTPGRRDESRHETNVPETAGPAEIIEGLKDWTVRRALATPQFYIVVAGYTTYLLINTVAHGFATEHLTHRGISENTSGHMLSIEAFAGAAVALLGGWLGERISAKVLMLISLVSCMAGLLALTFATDWVLMTVFIFGVGIGFGLSFLSSTMLLFNYFGKRPNLELFSIMCMLSTTAALGPALGGWTRDHCGTFTPMFIACVGVNALIFIAALFLSPPSLNASIAPSASTVGEAVS